MKKRPALLAAAGAASLALGAGATAQPAAPPTSQPAHLNADLGGWTGGPDRLVRIINHIEQATGGRVLEVRYTDRDGPGFRAVVDEHGRIAFLRYGADTGDGVQLTETSVPRWMLHWRDRQNVHLARNASVSLADAVRRAEQAEGRAPAVAAGLAPSATNSDTEVKAYNVLLLRDGATRRIAIDDQTGQVIADPQALGGWPD